MKTYSVKALTLVISTSGRAIFFSTSLKAGTSRTQTMSYFGLTEVQLTFIMPC